LNPSTNNPDRKKGYIALLLTSVLWGTTWVASKSALQYLPGLQLSYLRQFIAGGSFLIYFIGFKKQPLPTLKDLKSLLVMSILMFVFANALSTWGLKFLPTGLAALIGALYPIIVVAIEWIFYKKRDVNKLTIIGLLIGIFGVFFVFYENMGNQIDSNTLFGLALSFFAIFCWSLGTVFLSKHQLSINPYYGMGWKMMIGSIILFLCTNVTTQVVPLREISFNTWMSLFYLIIIGSIISFIAFIYSLKVLPAAVASLYAYANPIVATITAGIVLHEKITLNILLGTAITILGVYIVNHSIKRDEEKMIIESEI
jgi:drug/metabolite transporter (DMT)-like permease